MINDAPVAQRRLDAQRNSQRILEAALQLFASDPLTPVDEIATEAGVGRATLYRHFPTREHLLTALRQQAHRDVADAIKKSELDQGSQTQALERLIAALISVGERFLFLVQFRQAPPQHQRNELVAPIAALIKAGQTNGEFATEAPVQWWLEILRSAILCASRAVSETPADRDKIVRAAINTVLNGLANG